MKRYCIIMIAILWSACLRPSDTDLQVSHSQPFQNGSLTTALGKQPNLSLFTQAFTRLGLAAELDSSRGYTIFAPTDSAMQADGLTNSTISSLPIDSLHKIITYHIVNGTLNDQSMINTELSLVASTLRQDTFFSQTTGHTISPVKLYIQEYGEFYFNGYVTHKSSDVIQASNGNLFPIGRVLHAYAGNSTTWDVISTDPDLTMLRRAIALTDSIKDDYFLNYSGQKMSDMFPYDVSTYWLSHPFTPGKLWYGYQPTLLAPTNAAFNKAGIYTDDDLLALASTQPYGFDPNSNTGAYNFSSLDSIIGRHMLFNTQIAILTQVPNIVLYNDMLHPSINNGIYNICRWLATSYYFSGDNGLNITTQLEFKAQNGVVNVNWHGSLVPIVQDADMTHPQRSFITAYGALYKVDQLFVPVQ
jgi:uncharacterized surface protein with fasciclin (FAS1) repeats